MHAFGGRHEASHVEVMLSAAGVLEGHIAQVTLRTREAVVAVDADVAVFDGVIRPGRADSRLVVVDRLLVQLLRDGRGTRVQRRSGMRRGRTGDRVLFQRIRITL